MHQPAARPDVRVGPAQTPPVRGHLWCPGWCCHKGGRERGRRGFQLPRSGARSHFPDPLASAVGRGRQPDAAPRANAWGWGRGGARQGGLNWSWPLTSFAPTPAVAGGCFPGHYDQVRRAAEPHHRGGFRGHQRWLPHRPCVQEGSDHLALDPRSGQIVDRVEVREPASLLPESLGTDGGPCASVSLFTARTVRGVGPGLGLALCCSSRLSLPGWGLRPHEPLGQVSADCAWHGPGMPRCPHLPPPGSAPC